MAVGVSANAGGSGGGSLADKAQTRRARIAIFGGVVNKPVGAQSRFITQKRKRFAKPLPGKPTAPAGAGSGVSRVSGFEDDGE